MQRSVLTRLRLVAVAALPLACATAPAAGPVAPAAPALTASPPAPGSAAPSSSSISSSFTPAAPAGEAPAASSSIDPQVLLGLARLAGAFNVPFAPGFVEHMVRTQLGMRDFFHHLEDRFADLIEDTDRVIPDLTILTTEPVAHTESSGFGWRDDPIRHTRRFHSGTDFRGKPGTPVVAAGDGVVTFAGRMGGYGNMVEVDHGGGVVTRYAHLRRIETQKNATITAGVELGQVGSTGRATGPHLHFEVRLDGAPVSAITAMSVAALQRDVPLAGRLAALALSPELQSAAESDVDPPKQRVRAAQSTHRPERPGRTKRRQVLW